MRKKTLMTSIGLVVCLLGAASCSSDSDSGTDGAESSQASGNSDQAAGTAGPDGTESTDGAASTGGPEQAATPDLSDVPEVVAEVNGIEITKDEFSQAYTPSFEQAAMQAQATGQPVDEAALREQTVQGLVSSELLMQASAEHGIEASDQDIDAKLEELASGNGMPSTGEFLAALEEQGMSADQVHVEVERMVTIDRLIEQEAKVKEPTEEEVRQRYDDLVAQQGGGGAESGSGAPEVPAFDEVKDQVAEQLTTERENEAVQTMVDDLRAEGEVTIHLESPDTAE